MAQWGNKEEGFGSTFTVFDSCAVFNHDTKPWLRHRKTVQTLRPSCRLEDIELNIAAVPLSVGELSLQVKWRWWWLVKRRKLPSSTRARSWLGIVGYPATRYTASFSSFYAQYYREKWRTTTPLVAFNCECTMQMPRVFPERYGWGDRKTAIRESDSRCDQRTYRGCTRGCSSLAPPWKGERVSRGFLRLTPVCLILIC